MYEESLAPVTKHALDDLVKLEKKEAVRIASKIKQNSELANPLLRAKALSGVLAGIYRYRIGDYRALFEIDARGKITILTVLRIKHRKEVYD
jgi:mRNA interferase RelE/StbE